jgi:hypothetical protein
LINAGVFFWDVNVMCDKQKPSVHLLRVFISRINSLNSIDYLFLYKFISN